MEFPLPAKALNLLVSSAKPAKAPILLKLGQQIEAKILQVSLENNTIKLQLGKTTVEAQPQPALLSKNNLANTPAKKTPPLSPGQTVKLLVTKLAPTPELKIEKVTLPTGQTSHNKTDPTKSRTTDLTHKIDTKPITLKLLTKPEVPTKVITDKFPPLQIGQKLPAKVIVITNKQIQLQILPEQKSTNTGATTQQPTPKPSAIISIDLQKSEQPKPSINTAVTSKLPIITGQTVTLEVTKAGKEPQFIILENKPLPIAIPEKIISETVKQILPIQQPPEVFVNRLILNLPTLSKNTNLPETLQRLAQQILQNLPSKNHLTHPQKIKQSIKNSGLFLESKLAHPNNKSQLQTQTDFKANILKFLQALKQIPPAPQAETTALEQETSILKQLQNSGESSVAKLVLDQLNSLPKEDSPKQIWHVEIPFVDQENSQTVSLQIEKDKETEAENGKENWSVNITLNPPNIGKVNCKISCCNQIVNTHFWSDLPKTTDLINSNLDYLKSQLEASGLKTGKMQAFQDTATKNPTVNLPSSNLIDEQI